MAIILVWQYRVKRLAKTYWNQSLIKAVSQDPNAQIVIATLGFRWIVTPLLRHFPVTLTQQTKPNIVACGFWRGAADRAKGKLKLVAEAIGESAIALAIVITDSEQDAALLAAAQTPCLVTWPDAEYVPAMSDLYVPLLYAQKIKNPHKSHILKRVIASHWSILVIAISFLSPPPFLNVVGLLMLNLSCWSIYEIGYWENDVIGEKYEAKPKLSENYARHKGQLKLHTALPWYRAIGIAIPALILVEASKQPSAAGGTIATALQMWPTLIVG